MKKLLVAENPVMQFLGRLCDLVIVNVLFLLCCVPVVTIGASLAGMTKVTQDMVRHTGMGITKTFFRAFRDNFRQATVVWLAVALFFVCAFFDLVLFDNYFSGTTAKALWIVLGVFAVMVVAVACYMLPLLVRYENTLREHCRNALLLTVLKMPRTVCLVAITLLPFALAYFSPLLFIRSLLLWTIIGFSVLNLLGSRLLLPVMNGLEPDHEPPEDTKKAKK